MEISVLVQAVHFFSLLTFLPYTLSTNPVDREDVMGLYTVTNEEQCRRLCWYRPLCSTYSYRNGPLASHNGMPPSVDPICVLHTDIVNAETENGTVSQSIWVMKRVISEHINNGCKTRPCSNTEMCVPTSSAIASHVCLPLPSQCSSLQPVDNGDVSMAGTQDDVARVVCRDQHVESPKHSSMDTTCLIYATGASGQDSYICLSEDPTVTSRWKSPPGRCLQYEFDADLTLGFSTWIPWKVQESSQICIKGAFDGDCGIDFQPEFDEINKDLHLAFRTRFAMTFDKKTNGAWADGYSTQPHPFKQGNSFELTLVVLNSTLNLMANGTTFAGHRLGGVFDISQSNVIRVSGGIVLTYVNLISGC